MADDNLTIGELGAYTNNSMNREGIKKLVDKVNAGGGVEYTAGDNISISSENVISATDTKYTAGTGIAISEQNVISASGGEWTLRTPDNDWTDMFEVVEGYMRAKVDIYLFNKNKNISQYIPKGLTAPEGVLINELSFYVPYTYNYNNNTIVTELKYFIKEGNLTSGTNLQGNYFGYTLTITDNVITCTPGSLGTSNLSKSDFIIYTKD